MRLPGTLKALLEQLGELPCRVSRVTVPTENGPFVLEFGEAAEQKPARAAIRPAERSEPPDESTEERPKVRDTRMLSRKPPEFIYEEPS